MLTNLNWIITKGCLRKTANLAPVRHNPVMTSNSTQDIVHCD